MNAPVVILAVEPDVEPAATALTPAKLGLQLFEAAMRGEVALSDHTACWALLRRAHGHPSYDLVHGARRVATDLAQHAARRPDAALARTCRTVRDFARGGLADACDSTELPDAHAALDRIAEMLDGALALTVDGGS